MNVVLLSVDALRADHLSCYGYDRETSPVLERIAADNIRFQTAISASSHTREAVPSMLTGRYPDESIDESYELDAPLVSELLPEDVRTGAFHSNPFVSRAYGYDVGFDQFDDDLYFGQNKLVALAQRMWDKIRNHHYARAETINERSLDWLASVAGDDDIFLWNHYMDVHGPYEAPMEYKEEFGVGHISDSEARKLYDKALKNPDEITERETQDLVDLYDAEIKYVDSYIGEFIEELRKRELLNETLILITSDHGDAFGEHGYFEHPRQLHEELISVPMIAIGDDLPAKAVDVTASTTDLVPTILSSFGVSSEDRSEHGNLPGESLQSLWSDVGDVDKRYTFSLARGRSEESHLRKFSLHDGDKQILAEKNTQTGEIKTLGDPSVDLERALEDFIRGREEAVATSDRSSETSGNETVNDRLKALGYKE